MARKKWERERTDMTHLEVEDALQQAKRQGIPIRWRWVEIDTTGGLRPSTVVTLTPEEIDEDTYYMFLDLRDDLGGWKQTSKRSKLIEVNDKPEWASFKVVLMMPEGYGNDLEKITGYRIGAFVEFFKDDAKIISKILGITITRSLPRFGSVPMAGFPAISQDRHEDTLEDAGYELVVEEGMPQFIVRKL